MSEDDSKSLSSKLPTKTPRKTGTLTAAERRVILGTRAIYTSDDCLLYHYCSPDTFLKIMQSKALRYSDISRLNDAQERIWAHERVFLECMDRILIGRGVPVGFPEVSEKIIDDLKERWIASAAYWRPFACCFSSQDDSLLQWRAYSNDGEGFSIGFHRKTLSMPAQLLRVSYKLENQIAEMFIALSSIIKLYGDDGRVLKSNDKKNSSGCWTSYYSICRL